MDMNPLSRPNLSCRPADALAIFDHRSAFGDLPKGNLVSERDLLPGLNPLSSRKQEKGSRPDHGLCRRYIILRMTENCMLKVLVDHIGPYQIYNDTV